MWQQIRRDQIMARKNWWFMEKAATPYALTAVSPQNQSFPADFKKERYFYLEFSSPADFKPLEIRPWEEAISKYNPGDSGEPSFLTMRGKEFFIWPPVLDKAYTLKLIYYAWPKIYNDALGDASIDTDEISDQYPQLYLFSLTADGFNTSQEYDKASYWERKFINLVGGKDPATGQEITGELEIEHNIRMLSNKQPWEVRRDDAYAVVDPPKWRFY